MSASSSLRQQIIISLFFSSPSFIPPFIPPIWSASWQFVGLISKQKVLSGKSLRQHTLFGHSDRWWGQDALPRSGLLISELQRMGGGQSRIMVRVCSCHRWPAGSGTQSTKSHKPAGGSVLFLRPETTLSVRVQTERHITDESCKHTLYK